MTWQRGNLVDFAGGHAGDVPSAFPTLQGTDYLSIFNSPGSKVRSGTTSIWCQKPAVAGKGIRYNTTVAYGDVGQTVAINVDSHGFSSGDIACVASVLGEIAAIPQWGFIYSSSLLKLVVVDSAGNELWRGTTTITQDTWWIVSARWWNPTPGVASDSWRCQIKLANDSAVEQERSHILTGNQGGVNPTDLNAPGFGVWAPGWQNFTPSLEYNIDTYAFVSGGVWGPKDVKTRGMWPDTDGTDNQWIHATATTGKFNAVDETIDGFGGDDDTTYIQSNNAPATSPSTAATTGPPGTMTDVGAFAGLNLVGVTVTSGGKSMVIASHTNDVLTGTTGWSGGGNPGAATYTFTTTNQTFRDSGGCGLVQATLDAAGETVMAVSPYFRGRIATGSGAILTRLKDGSATGTSTAIGTGTPGTLTDSGASWTTNAFAGMSLICEGKTLTVASNTATVITGTAAWGGGPPTSGATYWVGTVHNGNGTGASTYTWVKEPPYVRRLSAGTSHVGGDGGSGWTVATVNALEFGVIRSLFTSNDRRVTACALEVLYGLEWDDTDPSGGTTTRELDNLTSTRRAKNIGMGVR